MTPIIEERVPVVVASILTPDEVCVRMVISFFESCAEGRLAPLHVKVKVPAGIEVDDRLTVNVLLANTDETGSFKPEGDVNLQMGVLGHVNEIKEINTLPFPEITDTVVKLIVTITLTAPLV